MAKKEYQYDSPPQGVYVKRSPDTFGVVLTSVITSALITLLVLFVTGNLHLPSEQKQAPGQAHQPVVQSYMAPALVGMPSKSAGDLLKTRGLRLVVNAERPDKSEPGTIVEQEPLPDSQLQAGDAVTVILSSGPRRPTVPKVVGKTLAEAKEIIASIGIEIDDISYEGTGEPGVVTQVTPATGTLIEESTKLTLVVAPEDVEAPDVVGMRLPKAKQTIEQAGLKVGATKWRYNEYRPANLVLAQDPKPKTRVKPGSEIALTVNEE